MLKGIGPGGQSGGGGAKEDESAAFHLKRTVSHGKKVPGQHAKGPAALSRHGAFSLT
jgi:hypothetical protein